MSTGGIVAARDWQGGQQESLAHSRHDLTTFSPDGRYLALCCDDARQQAQLWRVDKRTFGLVWIGTIAHLPWLAKCSFSPDGQHLVLLLGGEERGYRAREIAIYKVPSLAEVERIRLPTAEEQDDVIMDAGLSPNGAYLAIATRSAQVLLWDRTRRRFILSFQAHLNYSAGGTPYARYAQFFSLNQVAWAPDGSCLATGGYCPDPNELRFSIRLWRMVSVESPP
jgi:WD40 repeat protein